MRKTLVKNGIIQRMNDILGTGSSPGSLTEWSVQASMIENLERIVKSLVGDAKGRPMKGLRMSKEGDDEIKISSGFGMTRNGGIVVMAASVRFNPSESGVTDGTIYIYLKHSLAYDITNGKNSPISGGSPNQELVVDDLAATKYSSVGDDLTNILEMTSSPKSTSQVADYVYLGDIDISGGVADDPNNYGRRGLYEGGGYSGEIDTTVAKIITVENGLITGVANA